MAATEYVVLREEAGAYAVEREGVEAPNALTACRRVAEDMAVDALDGGVTLIAVPARNWNSGRHTLKAETTRRIRATS
jgi:hypothetical protein